MKKYGLGRVFGLACPLPVSHRQIIAQSVGRQTGVLLSIKTAIQAEHEPLTQIEKIRAIQK